MAVIGDGRCLQQQPAAGAVQRAGRRLAVGCQQGVAHARFAVVHRDAGAAAKRHFERAVGAAVSHAQVGQRAGVGQAQRVHQPVAGAAQRDLVVVVGISGSGCAVGVKRQRASVHRRPAKLAPIGLLPQQQPLLVQGGKLGHFCRVQPQQAGLQMGRQLVAQGAGGALPHVGLGQPAAQALAGQHQAELQRKHVRHSHPTHQRALLKAVARQRAQQDVLHQDGAFVRRCQAQQLHQAAGQAGGPVSVVSAVIGGAASGRQTQAVQADTTAQGLGRVVAQKGLLVAQAAGQGLQRGLGAGGGTAGLRRRSGVGGTGRLRRRSGVGGRAVLVPVFTQAGQQVVYQAVALGQAGGAVGRLVCALAAQVVCQHRAGVAGHIPRVGRQLLHGHLVRGQRAAAHGVELQRAALIRHGLGKAGAAAAIGEGQQLAHPAQQCMLVGQQLVKHQQIGLELACPGLPGQRCVAGHTTHAHTVGHRQVVGDGQVTRHLAVTAHRCRDVTRGAVGLRRTGAAAQARLKQLAGAGAGAVVVDAQATPLQFEIGACEVKTGAALGVDGQQPVAADRAIAHKAQALDGGHAGHRHHHLDQVRQAQRAALAGGGPIGGVNETAVQQWALEDLVHPPAALQHVGQAAEGQRRRQVAGHRLVNRCQQRGGVMAGLHLDGPVQRHGLRVQHADAGHIGAQAAPLQQALRGVAHQAAAVHVLTQAGFVNHHLQQAQRAQAGQVGAAAHARASRCATRRSRSTACRQATEQALCRVVPAQGLVQRAHPGVAHAGQIHHQLAQIVQRDGCTGQHLRGGEQAAGAVNVPSPSPSPSTGQQIGQAVVGAVAQIGQRVTQRLQQGDAGVVGVVIGPVAAGQALQQAHALVPQGGKVKQRVGGLRHGGLGC